MIFIRFNNIPIPKEEIFKQVEESGLTVCCCAKFKYSIGLETCLYNQSPEDKVRLLKSGVCHIHGIYLEYDNETDEEYLKGLIKEYSVLGKECIECTTLNEFITKCKTAWGMCG